MSGNKGMKHYPVSFKAKVVERYHEGESVKSLSRQLRVSRYAIQSWSGLRKESIPTAQKMRRGRPRTRPITTPHDMALRIKELEREVELYRSFLQAAGRM
jgi:transposase-like protein